MISYQKVYRFSAQMDDGSLFVLEGCDDINVDTDMGVIEVVKKDDAGKEVTIGLNISHIVWYRMEENEQRKETPLF